MHIQESGEMYLETILILSKTNPCVRAIDIGEYMDYSKPSVSRAMRLLKEAELIRIDPDGAIHLSEEGRQLAEKIYERHTLLTQFLMRLGVEEATADADACKIEHVISDETFQALKHYVEG